MPIRRMFAVLVAWALVCLAAVAVIAPTVTTQAAAQASDISIVAGDPIGVYAEGSTVTFPYTVTNSGSSPLADIVVSDNTFATNIDCRGVTTLDVGQSMTCTATYTLSAADIGTGLATHDVSVAASTCASQTLTPALASEGAYTFASGDTGWEWVVDYTDGAGATVATAFYQVQTDTGYTNLNALSGDSFAFQYQDSLTTGTHRINTELHAAAGARIDAGNYYFDAQTSAFGVDTTHFNNARGFIASSTLAPSLYFEDQPDEVIEVDPPASLAATEYTITDRAMYPAESPSFQLKYGYRPLRNSESVSFIYDQLLTTTNPLYIEQHQGTLGVTGCLEAPVQATDAAVINFSQTPGMSIISGTPVGTFADGEVITFPYRVSNTGSTPIQDVQLVDDSLGIVIDCGGQTSLGVGESISCSGQYTLSAEDLAAGTLNHSVGTSGAYCSSGPLYPDFSSEAAYTFPSGETGWEWAVDLKDASGATVGTTYTRVRSDASLTRDYLVAGDSFAFMYQDQEATGGHRLETEVVAATNARIDAGSFVLDGQTDMINTASFNNASAFQVAARGTASLPILLSEDQADEVVGVDPPAALAASTDYSLTDAMVYSEEAPQFQLKYDFAPIASGASAAFVYDQVPTNTLEVETHEWALAASGCVNAPIQDTYSGSVDLTAYAQISVVTEDPIGVYAADEVVTFPYTITNNGSEPLSAVEISSDSLVTTVDCGGITSVLPGETITCTGDYTLTAADMSAAEIVHDVSVSGTYCSTGPLYPSLASEGAYTFANGDSGWEWAVDYDDLTGATAGTAYTRVRADAGSSTYYSLLGNSLAFKYRDQSTTGSHPVETEFVAATGAHILGGSYIWDAQTTAFNTVDTFNNANGFTVNAAGTASLPILLSEDQPDEVVEADPPDAISDGTYYAITDIEMYANEAPGFQLKYDYAALDPNASALFAVGLGSNVALDYEEHQWTLAPEGCVDAAVANTYSLTSSLAAPALDVVKSAPTGELAVGQTINYSIEVTNSGNEAVSSIIIDDPLTSDEACPETTLAVGASMTCTGSYVITQTDIDNGSVDNTVTVSGVDPGGTITSATSSNSYPFTQTHDLVATKTGTPVDTNDDGMIAAGEVVDYTFTVTNTGNTSVTDLGIVDFMTDAPVCDVIVLAPGAVATCTASHTLTQGEVDAGRVDNTAYVMAENPDSTPVNTEVSTSTPIESSATLLVTKSAPEGELAVGQTIDYSIDVSNSGNVTVSSIVIDDPLTSDEACPETTLAVGASMTCTGTYVITQTDIDNGSVDNTVTVSGVNSGGAEVSATSSNSYPFTQTAGLAVSKTGTPVDANNDGLISAGETVEYTITVTNGGNTSVTDLVVTDSKATDPVCDVTALAPGEAATCTASYGLLQDDVDAGVVETTASATGLNPDSTVVEGQGSTSTAIPSTPALVVAKSAPPADLAVGQTINYSIEIANTGNVTLDPVVLEDALTSDEACPSLALLVGESMLCSATYVVTQADVDAGSVDNTAQATGSPAIGEPITAADTNTFPLTQGPALSISKGEPIGDHSVGSTVMYPIVISNDGDVTVSQIAVTDSLASSVTCDATELAPGAAAVCSAPYTITAADHDAGEVTNTASMTALAADGTELTDSTTITIPLYIPTPTPTPTSSPTVEPSPTPTDVPTEEPTPTPTSSPTEEPTPTPTPDYFATPGEVPTEVPTPGDFATPGEIPTEVPTPGDFATPTEVPTVEPTPTDVPATPAPTATPAPSSLKLSKDAPIGDVQVDSTVTYPMTVENTGQAVVSEIVVIDSVATSVTCEVAELAPGESTSCSALYTFTPGDLDVGLVVNTASVTGLANGGETVSDGSTVTVLMPSEQFVVNGESGTTVRIALAEIFGNEVVVDSASFIDPITHEHVASLTVAGEGTWSVTTDGWVQFEPELGFTSDPTPVGVTTRTPNGGLVYATETINYQGAATPTESPTPAETPTGDPTPTATDDPYPTTPPTLTPTPTVEPTPTPTPEPTPTVAPTSEPTATATPEPTATATSTPETPTPTPTEDSYPVTPPPSTATPTATVDPTATSTPSPTSTPTQTSTKISLFKGAPVGEIAVDATVTYPIVATNEGDTSISGVSVTDPIAASVSCDVSEIAPGDSVTCSATYTVTQADFDAGSIVNTASVVGKTADGERVVDEATATVLLPTEESMVVAEYGEAVLISMEELFDGDTTIVVESMSISPATTEEIVTMAISALNTEEKAKELVVAGEGTWTILSDGSLRFVPEAGLTNDPTPVKILAQNAAGDMLQATAMIRYVETVVPTPTLTVNPTLTVTPTPGASATPTPGASATATPTATTANNTPTPTSPALVWPTAAPTATRTPGIDPPLAFTGRTMTPLLIGGAALILIGVVLIGVSWRRRYEI